MKPVIGDDDVVLQANAQIFLTDVDARFHRKHMTRGDGLMPMTHVVNVQTNEM